MHLAEIHRYPVKALPGEQLDEVTLTTGEGLPHDRRFALTNGIASTMDGAWMPCRSFFINAVNDGMLQFSPHFDEAAGTLTINSNWSGEITFSAGDARSLEKANAALPFFLEAVGPDAALPPMVAERSQRKGAPSGYWDFTDSAVSILNLASVSALSDAMGMPLDPRRFRCNLLLDGLAPWEEFGWLGKRIAIGDAELEIIRPAQRCPATSVNPETAIRDLKVPDSLQDHFGHAFCGMYARVVKEGAISRGSTVEITGNGELPLAEASANGAPDYRLWPKTAEVIEVRPNPESTKKGQLITLESTGPWPLPAAGPGQRLRIHLGSDLVTAAEVADHRNHTTVLHAEPSQTGDPATAHLLEKVKTGDKLIVTGPFGRMT